MGSVGDVPDEVLHSVRALDRRTAVKALAGGAVASLVWAEPTIKGLARRPAYAGASSAPSSSSPMSFELLDPPVSAFDDEVVLTTTTTDNGTPVEFFLFDGFEFGEPAGTLILIGAPGLIGCECGIAAPGAGASAEIDYVDADLGLTVTVPGTYDVLTFGPFLFALPPGATPTRIAWTDLVVECA